MPIETSTDSITLKHPSGSTVHILFYGATIVSWKVPDKSNQSQERLFVSSKAVLDGSKPVRGGIPVVFPCFGAPTHPDHSKLSQHGFARSETWTFEKVVMDNEAGVSVSLVLVPTSKIAASYERPFHLSYVVTLVAHQLSTDLHVTNTSTIENLEFQALLHTYIRAPSDAVRISPLQGLHYFDKTEATDEARATAKLEHRSEVDVTKFTDSVYENAPLKYNITWPGGGIESKAQKFKDVVIWNPQEEGRKIGDMEVDGWKHYICVEPGYVRGFKSLEPKETWIGQQILSVIQE
ncbi:galactose mutarotase-like protein [Pholiota conissans]|uniref:Glucose-6-phosphate 1-epimerase n=1 Tax=Pholiota conissans TaxID=109636 RepID=A0A9P5Z6B4_9AGAR|nr:galactose mutarotase-like protein [Pholiota conissans]